MMKYTLKEFKGDVIPWSTKRDIIKYGSITGQNQKIREECAEVSAEIEKFRIGKGDLKALKTEIGDIAVVLINIDHMQKSNSSFSFIDLPSHQCSMNYDFALIDLSNIWQGTVHSKECYTDSWVNLMDVCVFLKVELSECAYLAFKKIEHRKGRFCKESMSWVKES